jgi:hypothetical protein
MEIKGILKQRTNSQSGTSQRTGQQWRTDEWLVVIPGQYEKKINFEVRGVERCKQWEDFFNGMPDKNAPVMIKFEINAREHESRYFNSVEAWDIAITTW